MKKLLLLIYVVILFVSCEEKDIELFDGRNQIYFDKFYMDELYPGTQEADSTVSSFFFYADDVKEISADIIVNLSGLPLKKDTPYKIKVVEEETTANSDEYEIQSEYVFSANNYNEEDVQIKDTLRLKLFKSERLSSLKEGVRIVVELLSNDLLDLGQYERRRAVLISTTRAIKPNWWNDEVSDNLLGDYTEKKFKLFLNNIDTQSQFSADFIKNHPDQAREMVMRFKKWLNAQEEVILDEDGKPMSVNI